MLMARSTYEGMKLANENKRPFVLTRAGFIGSQRYAATWIGDNLSNWEHLHMSISMVLQLVSNFRSPVCLKQNWRHEFTLVHFILL
jgi:alpha-glucosidase (family GH31 glycosyl hydrolase)